MIFPAQSRAQAQAGGGECCWESAHTVVHLEATMSASRTPGWDPRKTQTQTLLPRLKKRNGYMHRLASERLLSCLWTQCYGRWRSIRISNWPVLHRPCIEGVDMGRRPSALTKENPASQGGRSADMIHMTSENRG